MVLVGMSSAFLVSSSIKMICLVILLFNVFIPSIYSEVVEVEVESRARNTVNNVPWDKVIRVQHYKDAYEYAKHISFQLSNQLMLHMNRFPGSLRDFDMPIRLNWILFEKGTPEYKGLHGDADDLIQNASFNVRSNKDLTIIEFAPNFYNFSVAYNVLYGQKQSHSNEIFKIFYDRVPINVRIERRNGNGKIKAKIEYGGSLYSRPSFGEEYDSYLESLPHQYSTLTQVDLPQIQKDLVQEFFDNDEFKARLCDLFLPGSKLLQSQLENILRSLPYPTDLMTLDRWSQIIHKVNEVGLRGLYGKEYAYAEQVSASLGNALATAGKFRKWPAVLVPLPPFMSTGLKLRFEVIYTEAIEFLHALEPPYVKPGTFSIQTYGNETSIRFTPNYRDYTLGYGFQYRGLNGKFSVSFKNVPIKIEIIRQRDTGETTAQVFYDSTPINDYRLLAEYPLFDRRIGKPDYTLPNYLVRQFYESVQTRNAFCSIFEPESTFLQPQLDVVLTLYPFPADQPKDFLSFDSQLDGFANLLKGALSSL